MHIEFQLTILFHSDLILGANISLMHHKTFDHRNVFSDSCKMQSCHSIVLPSTAKLLAYERIVTWVHTSTILRSAPQATKHSTVAKWPPTIAQCKAVLPHYLTDITQNKHKQKTQHAGNELANFSLSRGNKFRTFPLLLTSVPCWAKYSTTDTCPCLAAEIIGVQPNYNK